MARPERVQWEYQVVAMQSGEVWPTDAAKTLGERGWESYAVTYHSHSNGSFVIYHMKRRKTA